MILREAHIESHKMNEGRKLETEYMLKQMIKDTTSKKIRESVEEYERKQKYLEQLNNQNQPKIQTNATMSIKVDGEPYLIKDHNGNDQFNKMKRINEDLDKIQANEKNLNRFIFNYFLKFI